MHDLLFVNGTIHTCDPLSPGVSSIACRGGLISAINETVSARRVIDLKGRTVIPGLIDAHVHLLSLGQLRGELDLGGIRSFDEAVTRVREKAKPGVWMTGRGWDLSGEPDHRALSEAAPESPVWLERKDGHSGIANRAALQRAGITRDTVDPAGGRIGRDAAGEPTGMLYENAVWLIDRVAVKPSAHESFLEVQKEAMRLGIVGIHDAFVDDAYLRLLLTLHSGRLLRLRVHAMYTHEQLDRIIDFMRDRAPQSGRLSIRAIKVFFDGSLGSRTAAMLEPFCGSTERGMLRFDPGDVERVARAASERGYQVCTHAIGDRANREILGIYERVNPAESLRWRVEHVQHVHPADLSRLSRWWSSVQPSHCVADRELVDRHLGAGRREGSYAWRRMARRALGTDAPVEKLDPRWTFYCAVTREGWGEGDVLTPQEALHGMTAGAAEAGFMEGGVLCVGLPADLVVLSSDWLRVPAREVLDSQILMTIMDGRVAHEVKGAGL